MDRSLQPVYDQMNDFISNYTDGNIDISNRLRALNRAIEDVHRRLGLTCDETIFTFQYVQGNMYQSLPVDFDEPIILVYENSQYNNAPNLWNWALYTYILQRYNYFYPRTWQKLFSSTNINGSKQLLMVGPNIYQGGIINAFNSTNLLSPTGDATNLAVDNNLYVTNGGSVSFTIDPTLGNGYAGILTSGFGFMNVQQALQQAGVYGVWSYLQTTAISHIDLIMTSSAGNYYTFTATAQSNTLPFAAQAWNQTNYPWTLVGITGSPDSQQITSYEFRYYEGSGFGGVAIPYFRINDFFLQYPDTMNLVYYSQYKGTDATGMTQKIILDDLTDLPNFMQFFPDFINMVALRAAYILMPQLAQDKDFMAMYNNDYIDAMKDLGKIYPRKRIVNLSSTLLQRP